MIKRILLLLIPLFLLSIHTGYVYHLNKIDERKIRYIEEKLLKQPTFSNYMSNLNLEINMMGDYEQSQVYNYIIVGTANENFIKINERRERRKVFVRMSDAARKNLLTVCGRSRSCKITGIKIIVPETKSTFKYKFPDYLYRNN